jgi:hypothetical protein
MKISQLLNQPTPSVSSLAKKYKTTPDAVQAELKRGIQVEMEHTKDPQVAREIALDHLGEDLHYYKKLSKIEKTPVKESTLMELFDLNRVPEGVTPPEMVSDVTDKTIYQFAVGKRKYLCQFTDVDRDTYDLKFKDPEGRMSITGAGNATKVFWGVARAVSMFIQHKPVALLRFGASEPSRQKLYNVLSQKLADTLGWRREVIKYPDNPASFLRLYNPTYTKQPLEEGRGIGVIVVDVQPAYKRGNERLFEQIIRFVNNQTGPVLMFVNAEQDMMTDDTVDDIKAYWEEVIRGEEWDPEDYDDSPIDWSRFQIKDKGFGFFRSFMDRGIEDKTIIRLIRLMYQSRVNDSRDLFGGEDSDDYAVNFEQFVGPEFKRWMLDDGITVNWTSVAQLKRFSGSYIVGGGRNECLREVELLMNAFNFKYKRIDSMVYG